MTKYQLVPYVIRVNVRHRPDESRPLDDLDAAGLDLADELTGLLEAHRGLLVRQSNSRAERPPTLRVVEVGDGPQAVCFVIAPGRTGIVSVIQKPDGTTQNREFEDTELVSLRHYLIYRPGSHRAVLLAERVGGDGAVTALRSLITQTWKRRHPDLVMSISPAGDEKIWESALAERPVVKYQMTRSTTADGRLAVSAKDAEFVLDVRPQGRGARFSLGPARARAAEKGTSLRQILLEEVTPVLAPGFETPELGAEALMDEGWSVAVQLELESGQKPTVNVETNATVTLTFPIIEGQEEPPTRPSDSEIADAVSRLVGSGVFDRWGLSTDHGGGLRWHSGPCDYQGEQWKVVWDVVASDDSNQPAPAEETG